MLLPRIHVIEGKPASWWNADHTGLVITIFRDIPCFAAVLAQEVYEVRYVASRGFFLPTVLGSMQREMELRGHTIEAVAARELYGADFGTYLAKEARAVVSYPQFKGWAEGDVLAAMRKRAPLAERWVAKHLPFLKHHMRDAQGA